MANFINENDCGIYISRAEGWCLGALESMSCKKPVITTNYSAFTEYCTKDNSYLVDITEKESAYDGKWFFNQGNWASIGYDQEEQIIEYMRHCYNNRPDNPNGILTAEGFTWNHTATKLLNLIQ
jgi:glycosyltransferase involved in cell wall biosynthesis